MFTINERTKIMYNNKHDDSVMLIMARRDQMKEPAVKAKMREIWDILSRYEAELTNFGVTRGGRTS